MSRKTPENNCLRPFELTILSGLEIYYFLPKYPHGLMASHNLLSTLAARFPSPASDIALIAFAQFLSTYHHLAFIMYSLMYYLPLTTKR